MRARMHALTRWRQREILEVGTGIAASSSRYVDSGVGGEKAGIPLILR